MRSVQKTAPDVPIQPVKAGLANQAVEAHRIRSFADLGACWGVNAGYSLDLLSRHPIENAFAVDQAITPLSQERGQAYPQLKFVRGKFLDPEVLERVPDVDAVLMFDILLHQANPGWRKVLAKWAAKARVLIIFNQMWKQEGPSVRFIKRGREWYKENVHHSDPDRIDAWFDRHDEVNRRNGVRVRDQSGFWQWGITTEDLTEHAEKLGFRLDFFQNYGRFPPSRHDWIQNEGFIFVRM